MDVGVGIKMFSLETNTLGIIIEQTVATQDRVAAFIEKVSYLNKNSF